MRYIIVRTRADEDDYGWRPQHQVSFGQGTAPTNTSTFRLFEGKYFGDLALPNYFPCT